MYERATKFWQLLVSACKTGSGIPQKFLDEKAEEIRKRKEEEERIQVVGGKLDLAALGGSRLDMRGLPASAGWYLVS